MKIGSWITVPADPAMVFEKDPDTRLAEILCTLGEEYQLVRGYAVRPFSQLAPRFTRALLCSSLDARVIPFGTR